MRSMTWAGAEGEGELAIWRPSIFCWMDFSMRSFKASLLRPAAAPAPVPAPLAGFTPAVTPEATEESAATSEATGDERKPAKRAPRAASDKSKASKE